MMRRVRAFVTAHLIGAAAVVCLIGVRQGHDQRPAMFGEVVMMPAFVANGASAPDDFIPIEVIKPASAAPASPGGDSGSVAFHEIGTAPIAMRLDTRRDSYVDLGEQLRAGRLPARDAIRLGEWIQGPVYDYAPPARPEERLAVRIEIAEAPWNLRHRLVRIALKAALEPAGVVARRVRADLTFDPGRVATWRRLGSDPVNQAPGGEQTAGVDFAAGGLLTALYEIVPAEPEAANGTERRWGTLTVAWSGAQSGQRQERAYPLVEAGGDFAEASADFRLAAAIAGLGWVLLEEPERRTIRWDELINWVGRIEEDDFAGRMEFVARVHQARRLTGRRPVEVR